MSGMRWHDRLALGVAFVVHAGLCLYGAYAIVSAVAR